MAYIVMAYIVMADARRGYLLGDLILERVDVFVTLLQRHEEKEEHVQLRLGHNYGGHNYVGHNYIGHNYIGHNYIGHNSHHP